MSHGITAPYERAVKQNPLAADTSTVVLRNTLGYDETPVGGGALLPHAGGSGGIRVLRLASLLRGSASAPSMRHVTLVSGMGRFS